MTDSLARQLRLPLSLDRSAYCSLLADEMIRRGAPGARSIVDEGIAFMERSGERHFEAELYRHRGELRLTEASDGDATRLAESDFQQALIAARSRGSRWGELVAATSLARLLRGSDRSEVGRLGLQTACAHFEDGGELEELSEAHEVLATLT